MAGHIEYPGQLNAEQAKNLAEGFQARHSGFRKSHKVGVLTNGATFKATSVNPEDSQLIEARRLAVEDVCRVFNIPPNKMGLPGTTTYSSVEQNNIAFSQDVIRPIVYKLEVAFGFLLQETPGAENAFMRFNMDAIVRADLNSRMSAYSTGLLAGFLTINDVRRLEDLVPESDPAASQVRVPLANVNIAASNIGEQAERVKMAQGLIQVGFDPASVLQNLGLPPMTHTGLASTQLQAVAQIDPENPQSVYEVQN
jgi:phage portal protein BeeE